MHSDNAKILDRIEDMVKKSKWQTKDGRWWVNDGSGKKAYQPKIESPSASTDLHKEASKKYGKGKINALADELKSNVAEIKNGNDDVLGHITQNTGDLADALNLPKKVVRQFVTHYLDKEGIKYDKSLVH